MTAESSLSRRLRRALSLDQVGHAVMSERLWRVAGGRGPDLIQDLCHYVPESS